MFTVIRVEHAAKIHRALSLQTGLQLINPVSRVPLNTLTFLTAAEFIERRRLAKECGYSLRVSALLTDKHEQGVF